MHHKLNFIILISMLTLFPITNLANSTSTTSVQVQPETCYVSGVGQTFTVNITVTNVTDLWGWEFQLFYSSIQLNGTMVEEGPFLKKAGETFFFTAKFTDNYNTTHGYIDAACILTNVTQGANGNGTLAKITFKSKACGSSILNLALTILTNSNNIEIPHQREGGKVIVGKLGDLGTLPAPSGFGNYDGKCDYQDVALLRYAYVIEYHPLADFNSDGKVNYKDANMFREYYITDP